MADSITFNTTSMLYSPSAATTPSIWGKTRNWIELIDGGWVTDVAKEHYDARQAGDSSKFNFWESYHKSRVHQEINHASKEAAVDAAKEYLKKNPNATVENIQENIHAATRQACSKNPQILNANNDIINKGVNKVTGEAATIAKQKPGFFGKMFGWVKKIPGMKFIGKHLGPLLMLGTTAYSMYQEVKNGGGLLGAGKELLKGLFAQGGFIGISYLATAFFGIVNPLGLLVIGIGGSILTSMLTTKILGKSTTEKMEEAKAQQEEQLKAQAQAQAQAQPQTQAQRMQMGPGDSSTRTNNPIQTDAQINSSLKAAENIFQQTQAKFNERHNLYNC